MPPRQSMACFGMGALAATFVSNLLQVPSPTPSPGATLIPFPVIFQTHLISLVCRATDCCPRASTVSGVPYRRDTAAAQTDTERERREAQHAAAGSGGAAAT